MKISKLFHWLYAIVMLTPFFLFLAYIIVNLAKGGVSITLETYSNYWEDISSLGTGSIGEKIMDVYGYLLEDIFGVASDIELVILYPLTYWTIVSIVWLVFDTLMYVPLLCHRWLDKGVVE